jgi:hypothetical protein
MKIIKKCSAALKFVWDHATYQRLLFVAVMLALLLSMSSFFSLNDPDYFWHYREGEYIFQNHSIAYGDRYSFSMPGFEWINHEWASDTLMYAIERYLGTTALSLWYVFLFALTIWIVAASKKRKLNIIDFIVGVVGFGTLLEYVGVRQQMYTLLFFALLIYVLQKNRAKVLWFLPLLFAVWANIHAGFTAGIAAFGLVVMYKLYLWFVDKSEEGKDWPVYVVTGLLSIAATLLNPYGVRVYEVILMTLGDSYMTKYIDEWLSLLINVSNRYFVFLAVFLALFSFKQAKESPYRHLILLIPFFFLLPWRSVKYVPYFVIIAIPYLLDTTDGLLSPSHIKHYKKVATSAVGLLPLAAFVLGGIFFIWPGILLEVRQSGYPSEAAVSALRSDPGERVFNHYNWGGYLIRYVPEKKYFIDGRMPSWWDAQHYAFRDYVDFSNCTNAALILDDYKPDTIFWPVGEQSVKYRLPEKMRKALEDPGKLIAKHLFGIEKGEDCVLLDEIKKLGWKSTYDDGNIIILKK